VSARSRRRSTGSRAKYYLLVGIVAVAIVGYLIASSGERSASTSTNQSSTSSISSPSKPVILYVNQGNGAVNSSNFGQLLSVATSHGFNTIFFQVDREGVLLFDSSALDGFVSSAHGQGLKIFFALYFTNSSQRIPTSIYGDGEDGINLDMSTLTTSAQAALLANLSSSYSGVTSVTSTDLSSQLRPDMLILETYGTGLDQYIHSGIVASVGVFTTTSKQQYEQEFQYALTNSDGVMVFDYAGLVKAGY